MVKMMMMMIMMVERNFPEPPNWKRLAQSCLFGDFHDGMSTTRAQLGPGTILGPDVGAICL